MRLSVADVPHPGPTIEGLVSVLDAVSCARQSSNHWHGQRAAFALAGAGVREAEAALRRYATMRSVDGSWRATRWSELPALLSLPLPERLSAIWARFPFEAHALAMLNPTSEELSAVLAILVGSIEQVRRHVPTGSACLLTCAAMAAQRGVALPSLETDWWIEQQAWGQAEYPTTTDLLGIPLTAIAEPGLSPALVRDTTVTTAFSRVALRNDLISLEDVSYRDIGEGWALVADLDHFKQVGDHYGLPSSDIALAQLADRLQRRFGDCLLRYSEKQFAVFWRGEGGLEVAEEIRALVEREPFVIPDFDEPLKLTVSVGATRFQTVGAGIEDALAALAKAKAAGRNCVRG